MIPGRIPFKSTESCLEIGSLAAWLGLIAFFVVINLGRVKMKTRFSLVLLLLSGVCLVLYFNETLCSVSPNLSLTRRTTYEDDARIRSILRLVDRFGLKELQEISEQYADRGRNISTQLNASQISNNFTVEKIEKEFDICSLGRFDVDEFLENHKKQCLIESAKEKIARKELLGISATQAVIQYQARLPPWELVELKSGKVDRVYYVGIDANKTQMMPLNTTNNFGFDEPYETKNKGKYRWKIGDHLAYRFELVKYLGGGTYGEVLKAIDHKYKQEVAIKMLNNYTSIAKHTMTEYNILTKINKVYPNSNYFIANLENFRFRNHFCMVFELLGDSAYDLYEQANFRHDTPNLRSYVSDILKGLVLLDSLDVIHNDMKPDNLLVPIYQKNNEPKIKVMDFGLSCVRGSSNAKCPEYYIQTRYYRSPEVMLALDYTSASDMWSLGVIVGEMFRGSEFIFGEAEADQFAAIMENIGLPPVQLIERSTRRKVYYEAVCYVTKKGFARRPYRKSISTTLLLETPEHDMFLDFLTRLLQWDPSDRMSAGQALNHPWITGRSEDMIKLPKL